MVGTEMRDLRRLRMGKPELRCALSEVRPGSPIYLATARSGAAVTHLFRLIPARLAAKAAARWSDGSVRTTN